MEGVAAVVDETFPWPPDVSRAAAVATPLHSDTLALARSGAERLTVTLVTGAAPVRYQISIRVFEPDRKPTGPLVQMLPAESVTDDTEVVVPACTAIGATRVLPLVDVIGTVKLDVEAGVAPVACLTKPIPAGAPAGVVTVAVLLKPDRLPAASKARTLYVYVVFGEAVVSP
jgi:hypothetical protein